MVNATQDDLDRRRRIDALRERARELAGGDFEFAESADCPLDVLEAFWQNVVRHSEEETTTNFEQLTQEGLELPPPHDLSDQEVSVKLREIAEALAHLHTFLSCTDHLSDRELYTRLWEDVLREEVTAVVFPNGYYMIDLVSSGSSQDNQDYLRYYADEEDREHWAESFPGEWIPPQEKLPYDRDRNFPQPDSFYVIPDPLD